MALRRAVCRFIGDPDVSGLEAGSGARGGGALRRRRRRVVRRLHALRGRAPATGVRATAAVCEAGCDGAAESSAPARGLGAQLPPQCRARPAGALHRLRLGLHEPEQAFTLLQRLSPPIAGRPTRKRAQPRVAQQKYNIEMDYFEHGGGALAPARLPGANRRAAGPPPLHRQ